MKKTIVICGTPYQFMVAMSIKDQLLEDGDIMDLILVDI